MGLGEKVVLALSKTIKTRPSIVYYDNLFPATKGVQRFPGNAPTEPPQSVNGMNRDSFINKLVCINYNIILIIITVPMYNIKLH